MLHPGERTRTPAGVSGAPQVGGRRVQVLGRDCPPGVLCQCECFLTGNYLNNRNDAVVQCVGGGWASAQHPLSEVWRQTRTWGGAASSAGGRRAC